MLGKKGYLVLGILLIAAIGLTGWSRLELDRLTADQDTFRVMRYLPRGPSLRLVACGFDSPLAAALFVKAMVFYGDPRRVGTAEDRRTYTYDLFDVITDLSPRFGRAYQMGSLFLTTTDSTKTDLDGCRLLEKGVAAFTREAEAGQPVDPDRRWMFHSILASTYDVKIQSARRKADDLVGALEARRRAGEEFRLAALSPGAPPYIMRAAAGYASVLSGTGGVENSQVAILSVWEELRRQALERGDTDILPTIDEQIAGTRTYIGTIRDTRAGEAGLSRAGQAFLAKEGRPPRDAGELVRAGFLAAVPPLPLGREDAPDAWLVLPDGEFRSRRLAEYNTANHMDMLLGAYIDYLRTFNQPPPTPQALVDGGFLQSIPVPPLQALGQEYEYDPKKRFTNKMPEGLEETGGNGEATAKTEG